MPASIHHSAPGDVRSGRLVRSVIVALVIAVLAGACGGSDDPEPEISPTEGPSQGLNANSPVTLKSVGAVVVGMNLEQMAEAAGVAMTRQPDFDQAVAETGCAYVSPATIPGYVPPPDSGNKSPLAFMIVDNTLVRIDILGGTFSTPQGIRVGSAETDVLESYGGGEALPPRAFIGPPYRYLTATPRDAADANFRMVFESDGAKVIQYRVGQLPQVENKQGCSP